MQFILGSQSPRRKEILGFFDLPFTQISPQFDEESIPFENNPEEFVQLLAKGKAESLAVRYPEALILTADTIVYKEGKIYGKPKDEDEACQFLSELAGGWHSVFTGLTLESHQHHFQTVEETRVLFNPLNKKQIHAYHQTLHFADKAGGYRIQGAGGLAIRSIEGCYYNVMGLPINALYTLLKEVGIDLWNHLKE